MSPPQETLLNGIILPPTQDELPCDDGVPMETQRHKLQMDLLIDQLIPWLEQREEGYVGGNMFLYFSLAQVRNQDFKGPDFFAVLGVPKKERKSWVVWEEGKAPDVIIELLSQSTASEDKTNKKLIYQNQVRVPEYFWYDPFNPNDWAGFTLINGSYEPIFPDQFNRLVSQQLGLSLVRWSGSYKTVETIWLRWATSEGEILPTVDELSAQKAEEAQRQTEEAQQRSQELETLLNRYRQQFGELPESSSDHF
ncbi:Uma2 family endonuclease [Planktothrix mougeotii]|uniref:Uma2 family endonuclease n=1 Tax=Planktothrix mougeotii LEGE 06226 TaxID=1828728 RepID=A0ABR9UBV7_9CYAN|nr:Uma2 family endonuclease [Planktothrix mougeotii]MBE9143069.1 Uma2 family endonuclease [Planktothrix mougeotii LEGE 06226]